MPEGSADRRCRRRAVEASEAILGPVVGPAVPGEVDFFGRGRETAFVPFFAAGAADWIALSRVCVGRFAAAFADTAGRAFVGVGLREGSRLGGTGLGQRGSDDLGSGDLLVEHELLTTLLLATALSSGVTRRLWPRSVTGWLIVQRRP